MKLPPKVYTEHVVEELKRLRYWFAGFEAAGGKVPLCEGVMLSTLAKATKLIEDHVLSEYDPKQNVIEKGTDDCDPEDWNTIKR